MSLASPPRRRALFSAFALSALVATAFAFTAPVHAQDKARIKVGISVGNAEQIFEVVKKVAARDGLTIDVIVFNDYQLPNAALAAGDLDANAFQHQPFLDNQIKSRGFDIVPVGLTITAPLGFYSRKLKSIDALPEGAAVGIQNDPSNGNRSLLLLQSAGLITLKPEAVKNNTATPLDVVANPKKLRLVALDAAQLPRSLDDLTIASINNDYAEKSGLSFNKDAILKESPRGPYANLIAVRRVDKDQAWAKRLVAAYQSAEVKQFIETKFNGALVPAF
jgi:D-methionine transport system substrate-binding protein